MRIRIMVSTVICAPALVECATPWYCAAMTNDLSQKNDMRLRELNEENTQKQIDALRNKQSEIINYINSTR